jgi:hypothetical protein
LEGSGGDLNEVLFGIYLKGLRKKKLQDNQCLGQDSNRALYEYESIRLLQPIPYSHPNSLKPMLIKSLHLLLDLPAGLFVMSYLNYHEVKCRVLSISRNVTPTIGKLLAAVSYARNEGH